MARLAGQSELALRNFEPAREWLMQLVENGAVPADVLVLLERVAKGFVEEQKFSEAAAVGRALVLNTPDDTDAFAQRALLYASAWFTSDPAARNEVLRWLEERDAALRAGARPSWSHSSTTC